MDNKMMMFDQEGEAFGAKVRDEVVGCGCRAW